MSLQDAISGNIPDFKQVEKVSSAQRFTRSQKNKFFRYTGIITNLSTPHIRIQNDSEEKLTTIFYEVVLKDDKGEVKFNSPFFIDEKAVYDELVPFYNAKKQVEIIVLIYDTRTITKNGEIFPNQGKLAVYLDISVNSDTCFGIIRTV